MRGMGLSAAAESLWTVAASVVIALIAAAATKIADQWDRAVVLRLGHFRSLEGPGLFFIIPVIDTVAYWVDTRVITTSFKAEKTLTKDTVPVDVDAVLFWKVIEVNVLAWSAADRLIVYWNRLARPMPAGGAPLLVSNV